MGKCDTLQKSTNEEYWQLSWKSSKETATFLLNTFLTLDGKGEWDLKFIIIKVIRKIWGNHYWKMIWYWEERVPA